MKDKNWSFTITGKGDEPNAVQTARDTVNRLRREDHKISDARFVLMQPHGDSREQSESVGSNTGKIDLLEGYGERSVPSTSPFSYNDKEELRSNSQPRDSRG